MNYIYSFLACLFVGIHLFSLKLLSSHEHYYNEIMFFMITTLLISRVLIYYAMKESDNPTNVHIILSLSVFVTFILSNIFFRFTKLNIYRYIFGIILIITGLYVVRISEIS
jgi:drug/metabolite transporter (DMT)-like permease